jgi:hypothetical protein
MRGSKNVKKLFPIQHSGYFNYTDSLWYIPSLDSDKEVTYSCNIVHDSENRFNECAYFQYAIIYSDYSNTRILRVINIKVQTSSYPFEVLENSYPEVSFAILIRSHLDKWTYSKSEDFGRTIKKSLIDLLVCYRYPIPPKKKNSKSMTKEYNPKAILVPDNLMP